MAAHRLRDRAPRPRTLLSACLLALAVPALAALVAAVVWTVSAHDGDRLRVLVGTAACWVAAIAAWALVRRAQRSGAGHRWVLGTIVLGLLAAGGASLSAPPSTSNDSARYAWDGIVQKAGISPYRDVPASDALADLRPAWLFAPRDGQRCEAAAPGGHFPTGDVLTDSVPRGEPLCTAINRPRVPTAYPPVAEAYFGAVRLPLPAGVGWIAFQAAGLVLALAGTLLLTRAFARAGIPLADAALWAWNPLVLLEAVNNAHVDALAAVLLAGAALALGARRVGRSGILFGLAVATKVIPAAALPGMLRDRPWRFAAAAVGTVSAVYVPYVLASGPAVLGYLPGYLSEEGYSSGGDTTRFSLPGILLPPGPALVVGVAALLAVWAGVWLARHRLEPAVAQAVSVGWALVIVCPSYAWYALMLIPLALIARRPEFLVVPAALEAVSATVGTGAGPTVSPAAMAAAAVVLLVAAMARRRARRRPQRGPAPSAYSQGLPRAQRAA
ncbi:glycosyltransferase family 87 protein [Sinomonas sp. P10A9]|uniref:Glycosyltransferase family 87 protein n=1 Tax=Sinomonas puerhi TaxID=3238584 RepID=A0AB39L363_9MICC